MNSQRILVIGGMLLFLLSAAYGLFYDGFLHQEQNQVLMYNLDMALNMAAKGDLTTASAFAQEFGIESQTRDVQAHIPWHLAVAGATAIAPVWLAPKLDISERMKRLLALLILSGGVVLAGGDFIKAMGHLKTGYYMTLTGYAWMALGLLGYFLYALLYIWLNQEDRERTKRG